jgi:hypothetical protein
VKDDQKQITAIQNFNDFTDTCDGWINSLFKSDDLCLAGH